MDNTVRLILEINEQGADQARAKIQSVDNALKSLQDSPRSRGAAPGSIIDRLQSGLISQRAALQDELSARSSVSDKASLVAAAESRRAAQEKLAIELQAKAVADSAAAARAASEQEYLGLLAKQKATLLEMARLEYSLDKTPAKKQAVADANDALVASKRNLANSQGEQAALVKSSQLYAAKAKNSKDLVADRAQEVKSAEAALAVEQQRLLTAQQLVAAAQQNVNALNAQRNAISKPVEPRTGWTSGITGPKRVSGTTTGMVYPENFASSTPRNLAGVYIKDFVAAGKEADGQLLRVGKTGVNVMKQTGTATSGATSNMRSFFIAARSAGSVLVGTSWQGGLYYLSQVGRTMEGAELRMGIFAVTVAAAVSGFAALAREGAKLQTVGMAFENLTSSAGIAGSVLAEKLQSVSKGVLTLGDSMTMANRALLAGGEQFASRLPELLEIARSSALASGQDIAYTFNSLITGIARGSPRLIDNADIYLRLGDANKEYAKQLGKTVSELSAEERQMATLNAVLKQGAEFTHKIGLETKTAAEKYKSAATGIKDFVGALGMVVSKKSKIEELANYMGELFQRYAAIFKEWAKPWGDIYDRLERASNVARRAALDAYEAEEALKRARESQPMGVSTDALASNIAYYQNLYDIAVAERTAANEAALLAAAIYNVFQELDKGKFPTDDEKQYLKFGPIADDMKALATATDAFWTKVGESGEDSQLKQQYEGLADVVSNLSKAALNFPEMPEIGKLVLPSDIANLRAFVVELKKLKVPQDVLDEISSRIDALASARPSLAEIDTLLSNIANKRAQPITGATFASGIEDAIGQLDNLAQKADEVGARALAAKLRGYDVSGLLIETGINKERLLGFTPAEYQAWLSDYLDSIARGAEQEIDKRKGLLGFQEKLANMLTAPGPNLKRMTMDMPELGTQLFTTDLAALDAYFEKLAQIEPENIDLINSTRNMIAELQKEKDALLETALAADDPVAKLRELAEQGYGAGASIEDLLAHLDKLPDTLRNAATKASILGVALRDLAASARGAVSLEDFFSDFSSGLDTIKTGGVDLAKYIGKDNALIFMRKATAGYYADMDALRKSDAMKDKYLYALQARVIEEHWFGAADDAKAYFDSIESASKKATGSVVRDAGAIKSAIDAALSAGLEVTTEDFLATKAGTYEDKPLENARRLDAIAERGFAELKAHPDWAGILGIPADVLSGTEEQLKDWSGRMSGRVKDLLEPDLINWDAFAAEYEQQLRDEKTRESTINKAYSELQKRGMIGPGAEAAAKKWVEEKYGKPKYTLETDFAEPVMATGSAKRMWDIIKNPDLPVDVRVQAIWSLWPETAPVTEKEVPAPPLVDAKTGKDIAGKQTTDALLAAMDNSGKDMAGRLYASFDEAVKAQTPSALVATYWSKDFEANIGLFSNMGTQAGNQVGDAFVTAIEAKTGKVRETLAKAVAGELLPELDKRYVRRGLERP